ncbi:hypothetical protein FQN53_004456 [Emmonsiellopsis sp. PD_33]|nr:hypothetical protein FQN53_004456 [Emmonsiellopsis sp. PD_33]
MTTKKGDTDASSYYPRMETPSNNPMLYTGYSAQNRDYVHELDTRLALEMQRELDMLCGEGQDLEQWGWNYTDLIRTNGNMQCAIPHPPARDSNDSNNTNNSNSQNDWYTTWSLEVAVGNADNNNDNNSSNKKTNKKTGKVSKTRQTSSRRSKR